MQMTSPSRADLEDAAQAYFAKYLALDDAPRGYDPDRIYECARYDIHLEEEFLIEVEAELVARDFGGSVRLAAREMLASIGLTYEEVAPETLQVAMILGARALRELSRRRIGQLTAPDMALPSYDGLFNFNAPQLPTAIASPRHPPALARTSVKAAVESYEARQALRELAKTTITETHRVLRWLMQTYGAETDLRSLTPDHLRVFRDQLMQLDRRTQGRDIPFAKRLTGNPEHQIAYATAIKYWRFAQQFFRWAKEDRLIDDDPSAVAPPAKPKGVRRKSPPPFTTEELKRRFASPLYAGHKSPKRLSEPGECRDRGGHWWSGVLFLHTGLRGGELAQLMPSDFVFDEPIPNLMVP